MVSKKGGSACVQFQGSPEGMVLGIHWIHAWAKAGLLGPPHRP